VRYLFEPGSFAYGGRMSNTLPGDGRKCRGRGVIHLTGANNYRATGVALGLEL
jgi:putative chitinase